MSDNIFSFKINLEVIIIIGVIYIILVLHTFCGCYNKTLLVETFTGANINNENSSPYDLTNNKPVNTSTWSSPNLLITPNQPNSPGVQKILNRPEQPVPLPSDELLLFANTKFKPECCPNSYSTSSGCACMTESQYNYLVMRGGNNVPYTQY
jgi:hypothetical protein